MRLRITHPKGSHVISLDDDSDIKTLLLELESDGVISSGDSSDLKIKSGFPPKAIELTDKEVKLLDIGIRTGEKLIVENIKPGVIPSEDNKSSNSQHRDEIPKTSKSSTPHVKVDDGYAVLRRVPDDNSCLFRAISYAVFHNLEEGSQLRSVVADEIRNDTITYNSAILGKPIDKYINWILQPTSWGGAIELQILSKHLGITIKSIDVETGRIDLFSPDQPNYIVLLYSGIHYDTVVFTPLLNTDDQSVDISVFEEFSDLGIQFIEGSKALSKSLNNKGYVTNTSTIKVKCKVCGAIFNGERQVSQHASEKAHYDFGEV